MSQLNEYEVKFSYQGRTCRLAFEAHSAWHAQAQWEDYIGHDGGGKFYPQYELLSVRSTHEEEE